MPQITVPLEFFIKERKQGYGAWRHAFWRELLSNSLDAGATRIDISVKDRIVSFFDNGAGMSREICENIYLSIGRSSKGDESGGVGGFGRARILTCFSMERYTILSQDYKVEGRGADYTITDGLYREDPGLGLVIEVPDEKWGNTDDQLIDALHETLRLCTLSDLEIYLNQRRILTSTWSTDPASGTKLSFDGKPWGVAHGLSAKDCQSGLPFAPDSVTGRVNGMIMFQLWAPMAKAAVVLEIDPSASREVLTSMRDNLKPGPKRQVDDLCKQIGQAGAGALSAKRVRQAFVAGTPEHVLALMPEPRVKASGGVEAFSLSAARTFGESTQRSGGTAVNFTTHIANALGYNLRPCVVSTDTESETLLSLSKSWLPGAEQHHMRVLRNTWEAALTAAFDTLEDIGWHLEKPWIPGFVFSDSAAARFASTYDYLLIQLNPLNPQHLPRFAKIGRQETQEIIADALHEACHAFCFDHDSDYANLLTQATAKFPWASMDSIRRCENLGRVLKLKPTQPAPAAEEPAELPF